VPLVEEEAGVSGSHKQSVASTAVVATEKSTEWRRLREWQGLREFWDEK
jgi:hypothetical protein